MPYDLRIICSKEFVQLDAEGHFDLAASRKLFLDAMWACVSSRIGCVLLDVRDAVSDMTAAELGSLAEVCRTVSVPGSEHKVAILTRPQLQFDRASIVASEAEREGWNIAVFHDFEQAFTWLIK